MRMTGSTTVALLVTLACTSRPSSHLAPPAPEAASQRIVVTGREALETSDGPGENFTGHARVQRLFLPTPPARMQGAYVTFEPGARTAWHSHPLGQILVITAGSGRIQQWGGTVQALHEGDVVWTPPGVKHWHGATPTTAMTHMALVEQLDGKSATWMEQVTGAQYNRAP
jgi:quercetin dioxygenase-like cupin family protein